MFASLLPKSIPFLEMLQEQNRMLREIMGQLAIMVGEDADRDGLHKNLMLLEAAADKLHVRIIRNLSQSFITPIDREDILRINQIQEMIIDHVASLGTRIYIFDLREVRFPVVKLIRTLGELLDLSSIMLDGLSRREDCHKTRAFHGLKDDCEMLLAVGLTELMDDSDASKTNTLMLFKWIQVYDRMEMLLNAVDDLSETLEEAVMKNV